VTRGDRVRRHGHLAGRGRQRAADRDGGGGMAAAGDGL